MSTALPGFSAEASIYRSATPYAHGLAQPTSGPVARFGPAPIGKCMPHCYACVPDSSSPTGCSRTCMTATCDDYTVSCRGCICPGTTFPCGDECCGSSQQCVNGLCVCPAPKTKCGLDCADLSSDPGSCGTCWHACTGGMICQNATCVCPPGTVDCSGTCVDVARDPTNCGACGHACAAPMICQNATCVCPPGSVDCGGYCTTLLEDDINCGACHHRCGGGTHCHGGKCVCDPGMTQCPNGLCVDLNTSPSNCGSCGHVCASGQSCCAGKCVNPQSDPANCGACGNTCPQSCSGTRSCVGGSCRYPTPSWQIAVDHPVTGCAVATGRPIAFSYEEALGCAQKAYPGYPAGAATGEYRFEVTCDKTTFEYDIPVSLSQDDATKCAKWNNGNCTVSIIS